MESKYMVIMNHIIKQLQSGELKSGSKLPSIRIMSDKFNCSINTVIQAYNRLEKERFIYSVPKSGYYVLYRNFTASVIERGLIDFASNNPDPAAIPYNDFYKCLNQAIELYKDEIFSFNESKSFLSLRRVFEKHLTNFQVFANERQIFVTSGARQAFHFLNIMPFPNNKNTVLVEQPSFSRMISSLELIGGNVIGITRTKEGINLNELENHFRNDNIKFFFTVPRNNPSLGTSYTLKQNKQIALLAKKYDVYIVEDDFIPELEIDKKIDPIFSLDDSEHTIYIKSFSKVLSPGLRIAIVVLPKNLIETFNLYKNTFDKGPAALSQGALEIFLTNGMYDHHVSRIRKEYQSRLAQLTKACSQYLPEELQAIIPQSGIYSSISFPERFATSKLINVLGQNNILVASAEESFLKTYQKSNSIRLSILRTDHQQINQGIRRIGEFAKCMLT